MEYRRALAVAEINSVIRDALEDAIENAIAATVPKSLRRKLVKRMEESPETAWDAVLYRLAKSTI